MGTPEIRAALLLLSAVLLAACGGTAPAPTEAPTAEQRLATLHGDPAAEAEFGRLLDRIQEGAGMCNPVASREEAADVVSDSWEQAGRPVSLLQWARNVVTGCGG